MRIKEKMFLISKIGRQVIIEIALSRLPRETDIWSPQLNETMNLKKSGIDHVFNKYLFEERLKLQATIDIHYSPNFELVT